jgi:hypothetical protein
LLLKKNPWDNDDGGEVLFHVDEHWYERKRLRKEHDEKGGW